MIAGPQERAQPVEEPVGARSLRVESTAFLPHFEAEWQVLAKAANRPLLSPQQTREWLLGVVAVWEKALREIDGAKPS